MFRRIISAAAVVALLSSAVSQAANIPTFTGPAGTNPTAEMPPGIGTLNQLITAVNAGVTPQSSGAFSNFRNLLDNGAMQVAQRGTATVTGGTTSGLTTTNYSADRWVVDTNVTSGTGTSQVITATPSPPNGFTQALKVYRNSGALLQPVCLIQEIPTSDATALQGQSVVLSASIQALSTAAAANTITEYVIYGTGSDEGLASSFTASPALTPAWTGIASLTAATLTSTTTGWVRYVSAPVIVPAAATEVGIEICYTPNASNAGTTDGFAITGAQLEQSSGPASSYEFRPLGIETVKAQRYYWQFAETVSGTTVVPGICSAQSSTVATCNIPLKVTMRKAPTIACTFGTLKRMVAGTDTALSACAAAATTNGVATADAAEITATVASGDTAGFSGILLSGNSTGGGLITATADF